MRKKIKYLVVNKEILNKGIEEKFVICPDPDLLFSCIERNEIIRIKIKKIEDVFNFLKSKKNQFKLFKVDTTKLKEEMRNKDFAIFNYFNYTIDFVTFNEILDKFGVLWL